MGVSAALPPQCSLIYVIDDKCPQQTGEFVRRNSTDPRVRVLFHENNQGVGGAVITGYKHAIADGATVIVKIDGDGQMDPSLLDHFVSPILDGAADYTKGNRFFDLDRIGRMPLIRIFGNAVLSFATKLSSGYWNIFDPTNGYTAIHAGVAQRLPWTSRASATSSSRTCFSVSTCCTHVSSTSRWMRNMATRQAACELAVPCLNSCQRTSRIS